MQRFLTRKASSEASDSGSSSSSPKYHHAAARSLKGKSPLCQTTASNASTDIENAPNEPLSHEIPSNSEYYYGAVFAINWNRIYRGSRKLNGDRLGYRVKHKSQLLGKREASKIFDYGADLVYIEEDGTRSRVWLCQDCHMKGRSDCARFMSTTAHIANHLLQEHRIDIKTGMQTDSTPQGTPFDLTRKRLVSHIPWNEFRFSQAYVDWVLVQDQSFRQATSVETRRIITWQQEDLLSTLPGSPTTLSSYIQKSYEERHEDIKQLLSQSQSKIALSIDIWTSPNHLPLLGVVAHFTGTLLMLREHLSS
jgi:hypothetical protein